MNTQPKLIQISTVPITLKQFLIPFAQYFKQKGWIVDAISRNAGSDSICRLAFDTVWDVDWSRNPLDTKNLLASKRIREIIITGKYDIVHVHTPVASFVTRYALRHQKKEKKPKIIYTSHGFHFHNKGNMLKNSVFLLLEKLAGSWTDYLVVINSEDEAAAKRYKLVPFDKVVYIPGIGIDLEFYNSSKIDPNDLVRVKRELGIKKGQNLFLMIAEFNPGKRHHEALKAFALLIKGDREQKSVLAFAGKGPLMEQNKKLALELGIDTNVRFLGFRHDIPQLIKCSDAVILTSEREGLPRSIMEAMALGVPTIGYDVRGVRDLLAEGAGILVPLGDIEKVAQAMAFIRDHPEKAEEMGAIAKQQSQFYDINKVLRAYEALYEKALSI